MTISEPISVIIAAYNAAGTIARAVRSALTEPEVAEVVVVDDASTDDTASRARDGDDGSGRLRILVQPTNLGPSAARNRAIVESRGAWISILDADDFFLPGRLGRLLGCAGRADLIADDIGRVSQDAVDGPRTSLLRRYAVGGSAIEPRLVSFVEFVLSNATNDHGEKCELGYLKPLMRREFLHRHRLRYQEHMRLGEDYELYARALALGARLYLLPVEGYISVMRPDSLSAQHSEADLLRLRDCDEALQTLPGLTPRDRTALHRHYLSVDCRLQWRLLIKAMKGHELRASVTTFLRPYPVPFYLMSQLIKQLAVRSSKKLERGSDSLAARLNSFPR